MTCNTRYVIFTLLLLPLQLFANGADTPESVVFKLYVNSKLWGQVNVLCEKTDYYINIYEFLAQLEYKYEIEPEKHFFRGYLSADSSYTIRNDTIDLPNQPPRKSNTVVWDEFDELFIQSSVIDHLYQIECEFIVNSLSLNITTKTGVPAIIRQQREEKMLKIKKDKEERLLTNIDTLQTRLFKLNALGYYLNTTIGTNSSNAAIRGNINGELLQGCFMINYDYSTTNKGWNNNNLTANWVKPWLNNKWLKTIRVYHDINPLEISSNNYATGITLSNDNTISGLMRGHTYQGKTIPNADVEIYNNNQLIQYLKSDSLGNYHLEIPSYEGDNNIKAVTYDSFGKPMIDESIVYMPPGLQEKKKLLYFLSSGFTDDGYFYIAPYAEYGLTKFLTVGASNETLFQYGDIKSIMILKAKYAFQNKLRLDMEYTPTVKWGAMLSGSIKNYLSGSVTYEQYNKNQKIILNAPSEKLMINFNGGIPMKSVNSNYSANLQYYKYGATPTFSSYLGINFWWRRLTSNLSMSTNSNKLQFANPTYTARVGYMPNSKWFDEFTIEYRGLHHQLSLRNRTNYQFKNKFNSFVELEYRISSNSYNLSCGISWRLPYMQVRAGVNNNKYSTSTYANVSGSVALHDMDHITLSDRYVGGGSVLMVLFADVNGDGEYNKNEPIIKDPKIIFRTGAEIKQTSHGTLYTNISPNNAFKITIPRQAFSDITWQVETKDTCVVLAPYQSRTLYFPVRILTELAGQVTSTEQGQKVGVANVPIIITHRDSGKITILRTDDWGYYTYMGVCGTYCIEAEGVNFVHRLLINPSLEGEQINNLNFEIQ